MTTPTPGIAPLNIVRRYPANPITPAGAAHMMLGDLPMMGYRSYDDAIVFNLMGPLAIWDPTTPESIRLQGLTGLIPPWKNISQKGATQDGSTFITSLYDPLECDLTVMAKGRDPAHTRKLVRDWRASWDAKLPGTLWWFSFEEGIYWWAKVRWAKPPLDPFIGLNLLRQKFKWTARCDDAFWRSYDSTSVFTYSYLSATENFDYTTGSGLTGWTIAYNGSGSGYLYANSTCCTSTLAGGRWAVAQLTGFVSASDVQVITVTLGPISVWPPATNTYVDIWVRMANTGTPGQNGVRVRLGYQPSINNKATPAAFVELSYFVAGAKTVLSEQPVTTPWLPGDQISVAVGGYNSGLYTYSVQRGRNPLTGGTNLTWQNLLTLVNTSPDGSQVGSSFRGAGFGMEADGTQIPPAVIGWTAGDSTTPQTSGYVTLYNVGDQPAWPYLILTGPGLFYLGDGPNATQSVVYGPLEQNQQVVIQTDPRLYQVTDLTQSPPPGVPASTQVLSPLQRAQAAFQAFLHGNTALAAQLSVFGTPFPQGNPYALLSGRFSVPVPAKLPGTPAGPQQIPVAITGGSPSSAILAGLTPLRRYPD